MERVKNVFTPELIKSIFEIRAKEIREDPCFKDDASPLFDESGDFNSQNWNSGQTILEIFLWNFVWRDNQGHFSGELETHDFIICNTNFYQDHWFSTVTVYDTGNYNYTIYSVVHYKTRGNTEMIKKDGDPISIEDYCKLLNLLNQIKDHSFYLCEGGNYAYK